MKNRLKKNSVTSETPAEPLVPVDHPEKFKEKHTLQQHDYLVQDVLEPTLLRLKYDYTARDNKFAVYAELIKKCFGIQQTDGTIVQLPSLYIKDANGNNIANPAISNLSIGQVVCYNKN